MYSRQTCRHIQVERGGCDIRDNSDRIETETRDK